MPRTKGAKSKKIVEELKEGTRTCNTCNETKDVEQEFYRNGVSFMRECKKCNNKKRQLREKRKNK